MARYSLMDFRRTQSQKERQEDQGALKQLGVPFFLTSPSSSRHPYGYGHPGNPSSYPCHQAILVLKPASKVGCNELWVRVLRSSICFLVALEFPGALGGPGVLEGLVAVLALSSAVLSLSWAVLDVSVVVLSLS